MNNIYLDRAYIGDDGTMDTVVVIWKNKRWTDHYRFDSEYRFSFNNDEEFLKEAYKQLMDDEDV